MKIISKQNQVFSPADDQKCKIFDKYYGNRKKLGIFQAHLACQQNQFHAQTNPNGFVNFGLSVNTAILKTTLNYLPQFIKFQDCTYPDPRGYDEFNKIVCCGTKFQWDQTFTFNNLYSILSLFCYKYKNVFIVGKSHQQINFDIVLNHSQSHIVGKQEKADLVILFHHSKQIIQKIESKNPLCVKLFILTSMAQLHQLDVKKPNSAYAYDFSFKKGLNLTALHTKDIKIKNNINNQWVFFTTSTITRRASLVPDLKIQIQQCGTETIRKMIQIDSKVVIPQQNIWFTLGVTSGLDNLSRALFKNCNLCVQSPYYVGFDTDLTHNEVKVLNKPMINGSKLIDRIKESYHEGFAGFIICNPKNPTGTILEPQQVDQICLWVKNKPNFHLIFDQIYLNTCFSKETKSAASYAIKVPNIHVTRGLDKDFGLCGVKIGLVISSNAVVMKKFQEWKPIISHHPFNISVINSMIRKSNFGTEIIGIGKKILKDYFDEVCAFLDKENISYIKPEAGCFVFVNLKQFMRQLTLDQEWILWKKLFYKYRVNLTNGTDYHNPQFGCFRVCPMIEKQIMQEGLRRIVIGVRDFQD